MNWPNMPTNLCVCEIQDASMPRLDEVFELYEREFAKGERESRKSIQTWLELKNVGRLRPNDFHILAAVDKESGCVVGFACIHYIADIKSGFLGYLAVSPQMRNRGIGSYLFGEVKRVIKTDAIRTGSSAPLGIWMELRKEKQNGNLRVERLRFWQRLDALPVDVDWRYPRLQSEEGPVEMYLAFCPMRNSDALSEDETRGCVIAIYRWVYGKEADDEDLAAVLASIQGKGVIKRYSSLPT